MRLIGTLGTDWLIKAGERKNSNDELLRTWRDHLENDLLQKLDIDTDLNLGERTQFSFLGDTEGHTIIEIEAFARKSLDLFLNRRSK